MDQEFQVLVVRMKSLLEVCDKQQISLYTDILDGLIAYIEEIVLMMHIKVGSADSVNVIELLYNDIERAWEHNKVSTGDKFHILKELQSSSEDRLSRLHKRLILLRKQQEAEIIMSKKETKFEQRNITDLYKVTDVMHMFLEKIKDANLQNDTVFREMVNKLNTDRKEYCLPNEVSNVKIITKRTIGRLIVQNVGNEGYKGKEYLRQQFQAVIDYLQKEAPTVWTDASITIYDDVNSNMYKVTSGNGKHQFICSMREDGPFIRRRTLAQQDLKCFIM